MTDEKDPSGSKIVLRALDVLECVIERAEPISLTDVAESVKLSKATALRLLQTLSERNYVIRDADSKFFMPGPMLWRLQPQDIAKQTMVACAKPYLESLAAEIGETAHISVLDGQWITYLDVVEPVSRIRAWLRPGETVPANCVASAKAILAFMPTDVVDRFLAGHLAKTTENSIIDRELLRRSIKQSRLDGCGVVKGEWDRDLHAMSVPVFGPNGEPVAAIGISGPTMRLDENRLSEILPILKSHATELSRSFGYKSTKNTITKRGEKIA